MTKQFSLGAVVAVLTGRLVCPLGDLYAILSYMVSRPVFTHEIPEACRVAAPVILEQHPELAAIDGSAVTTENWEGWIAGQVSTFGATRDLAPVGWNRLAEKSPQETAAEIMGEENVITLDMSGESRG